uniref:Transthyretin-like family protein n=1 Tax=Steinernema glaseri TaxID=37863 RepID=A0A1I7ZPK6_9BILA
MKSSFPVYLLLLLCVAGSQAWRQQTVGIRGKLMCGDQSLKDTTVKLWNKNHLGTDDQLADMKTDSEGNYQLEGGVGAVFAMDVHFKIYHDCDDGITPCQRKVNLKIPSEFVTRTSGVEKWFDGGVMNMQFKFPDEERSCIN